MSKKSICFSLLTLLLVMALAVGTAVAEKNINHNGRLNKPTVTDTKLLDVNEIECFIQNNGPLGENPATGGDGCFYPKGQRERSIIYTAGLWLLGKIDGDIRSAVCQYSSEYQPGAILPDGSADDATAEKYQIYKYNKGDVVDQVAIDQGCPVDVIGDQMLFCVYNDLASHAGVYTKAPIGIEVQQLAFAFNRTGALGKTIFVRYRFINKNKDGKTLEEAYVGVFFDPDLGDAGDDATGSDADLGIAYVYNGDDFDIKYGAGPPALACDFFQGPMVDAPGETAVLPDGSEIADRKILDMTAYFTFINGSSMAGLNDPDLESAEGATQAYFFVQGFRGNGEPWNNPITGEDTKFPLSGDPVAGTGWLFRHLSPPKDIRMGNAAGPFVLEPGHPQDVVVGLVVGDGPTNLASVQLMKYNDAQAQMAYDLNFVLPNVPPSPIVEVSDLDGEIMLTWDDAAATFDDKGYLFEGYNVFMAEAAGGPWTRIATFDVANSITAIWDDVFDVELAAIINKPVQVGTDTGVKYNFHVDKDYINNVPLINGKKYYFAVSAYAYNETGTPRSLETAKLAHLGIPQRPVMDTEYNAEVGDALDVTLHGPSTDSYVNAIVVDPAKVTGHDYRINLNENEELGFYWDVIDVTTGETVLANQTNLSGDEQYLAIDGVQIVVRGITPSDYGMDVTKGYYHEGWDYDGSRYITGVNWGGSYMWGGLDLGENFWGSNLTATDYVNIKIDFWNAASNAADPVAHPWSNCQTYDRTQSYAANGIGTFPGAAYDVEDTENPRRINITYVESDLVDHHWDPIAADAGDGLGGREYLFINRSDYLEDPTTLYTDDYSGMDTDVLYAMWVHQRGSHTSDEEFTMYIWAVHPFTAGETYFTFSTADQMMSKNADVAEMRLEDINIFPNPYFGHNKAENNFFTQFVTFNNLPEDNCTIRIFSLSGTLVTTIEHNDGTPFERWYLLNDEELPVASGMYIVHVETEFGNKILKLGVVNREARYNHM